LVILVASVFQISCGKTERTDKHINTAENRTHVSTGNKMLSEIADLAQVPPPDELEKAYTSPLILAHSLYYVN